MTARIFPRRIIANTNQAKDIDQLHEVISKQGEFSPTWQDVARKALDIGLRSMRESYQSQDVGRSA